MMAPASTFSVRMESSKAKQTPRPRSKSKQIRWRGMRHNPKGRDKPASLFLLLRLNCGLAFGASMRSDFLSRARVVLLQPGMPLYAAVEEGMKMKPSGTYCRIRAKSRKPRFQAAPQSKELRVKIRMHSMKKSLAAKDSDKPAAHGQDNRVGNQVRREHPRAFICAGTQVAGNMRQSYVCDAGIQHLHESGQRHHH